MKKLIAVDHSGYNVIFEVISDSEIVEKLALNLKELFDDFKCQEKGKKK